MKFLLAELTLPAISLLLSSKAKSKQEIFQLFLLHVVEVYFPQFVLFFVVTLMLGSQNADRVEIVQFEREIKQLAISSLSNLADTNASFASKSKYKLPLVKVPDIVFRFKPRQRCIFENFISFYFIGRRLL